MSKLAKLINLGKNTDLKSVGIYTFTNFFAKGASFLLLFIFTNPKYITPGENGLLSLFSNSMLFLMPFLSMGIIHSTGTDFFKLDKKEFRNFFTTGFILPLIVMAVSAVLLFLFREHLRVTYGFPYMFVWLIPFITFFTFCNEQLLSLARNNNEPVNYLKANVSRTFLELGLSVVLVVFFAWRWKGRIAGILVAYFLLTLYALYYFLKKGYLFGSVKKKYLYSELVYAVPIIVMQVSIFAMYASDKFFLSNFTNDNNETVGVYSVACVFASVIILFCNALLQFVLPKIYATLSGNNIDYRSIKNFFLLYLAANTAMTLIIIVLIPFIYNHFINPKYHAALTYSYILCIGYFLWAISYFFYSFLLYYKRKRKILALSLCNIVVSLSCNYFFISRWHAKGAATGVCLCYLIVFIITLLFTRQYWKHFLDKYQPVLPVNEPERAG